MKKIKFPSLKNTAGIYLVQVHHPFRWYEGMRYVTAGIRFFTESHWNHTSIMVKDLNGLFYIVEANPDGINCWLLNDAWTEMDKEISVWRPQFGYDVVLAEKLLNYYISSKPKYDYRGTLVYGLWYAVGKWFNKKLGTKFKWVGWTDANPKVEERFFCSEFAARIFNHVKPEMYNEWYKMTPGDLELSGPKFFSPVFKGEATKFINIINPYTNGKDN